ncbi:MAG: FdhF/YdeP family oxidoreductase, partial [Thermodesulfobacteriota bacterium]
MNERKEKKDLNFETPRESHNPRIKAPEKTAGGIPAILSTLKNSYNKMGVVRSFKAFLRVNQKEGFVCQSCAWPNPDERKAVEFCENGAKAVADEAAKKLITKEFFRKWTVSELSQQSDHWLGKQGRLSQPMVLREGKSNYEAIEWDDAFRLIADELNSLKSPDEAIFYTSGRTSNEAAFLYQLFVRQFGTNNLPDCSNMCHESSGTALTEVLGTGKGTVSLEDFELADAIFIIGQNPGTNHPRMLTSLQKASRNGCKVVSINPLPEAGFFRFKNPQEIFDTLLSRGTRLSNLFLQVRINGDVALLKGIMKEMLAQEEASPGKVFDKEFINEHTTGFKDFMEDLRKASWDDITEQSGISREQINEAASIAINSERMICCWAMGLTQHKNAVGTIQEVVNLLLLRGQIGKPGAGVCPVRGHSNVQGDRTMGIWEHPPKDFLDKLATEFNFEPPRRDGYDTVNSIKAMHEGKAKVFFAMGGNFLSATPDTEYTADALKNCTLTVQVSTKLNRSHLITGKKALILPCLGRSEIDIQSTGKQFVTVEDSMSVVSSSRGFLKPASRHLLSEPEIAARLAIATLGDRSTVKWESLISDYDHIREHIENVITGFDNFNSRIRKGTFVLPNGARERKFNTFSGKAQFTVQPIPKHNLKPDEYIMTTIRSHDQFNTTVYGLDDRYRGIYNGRRVVFLNPDDMKKDSIVQGQKVNLVSYFNDKKRIAKSFSAIPYPIPLRCAATY